LIAGISKRPLDCPVKYQISRRASEFRTRLVLVFDGNTHAER
jgi:hypothetical protein